MTASTTADRLSERTLAELPVSAVRPNPDQPRKMFKGIDELAASIRSEGLLQPITVRPDAGGGYIIIAGERRFRAIQSLGWETAPAIVVERDDREGYRLAVLENMARKDMSPVEEAKALRQLMLTMTTCETAAAVGYGADDGGQVTWKLKLLDCIEELQDLVEKGALGQSKAIQASRLSRNGQLQVLRIAGRQQLTDREWGGICDSVYSQENQTDMFPETKVSPEVIAERHELAEILASLGRAADRLSKLKVEVIVRGNRPACVSAAAQLKELGRTFDRVKRLMETEAGVALTLDDRKEPPS